MICGSRGTAFLLALMWASGAKADPFVEQEGQGRIIVSGFHTESARGFDNDGHVANIQKYTQNQVYVQGQYGLTDDLTLLLTPSYRDVEVKDTDTTSGLGYTDVGARYRLAHGSNWLVSFQGLIRIPGQHRTNQPGAAQVGSTGGEYDFRLGGGYTTGQTFLSLEGGYRLRTGSPPNEFHLDASAGTHITPRLMVLASLFNTFSDGKGQGIFNQSFRYNDVYLSAAYQVTRKVTFQAGYTATYSGQNALRQRGPFVGLWLNF